MQSAKLSFFIASVLLAGCAATADRESTGQVIDDSVITAKVKAKLVDDFALKGLQIQVETNRGVVKLTGYVTLQTSIAQAVADASSVEGVVSVQNNIQLK
ncbi:MAG TPA: BON domain-containing protein [Burkholderiaceae bacterium]